MQIAHKRSSRRDLLKAGFGTLLLTILPQTSARAARDREANIMDFGAAGDGSRDDTRAFQRAIRSASNLYVPAGTYAVSQIVVSGGQTIRTDGPGTIFQQLGGQPSATPLIRIAGSNVTIGSFTARGNIETDSGEWMHAVQVIADQATGSLSDIQLGDVLGKDVRGDVLMLSAAPGYSLSRVSAGSIGGDNVFRNVVSICGTGAGGGDVNIARIDGARVGLFHFDIEPDLVGVPVVGVTVGEIRGRNVGVVPPAGDVYADGIVIGRLDLSPDYSSGSSPDFPNVSYVRPHGLLVRNAKSLTVTTFNAQGLDGQAIRYVEGDLSDMTLDITSCAIADCCRTESTYYTYVLGRADGARIRITDLNVATARENTSVFMICDQCSVGSVNASMAPGTRLLNACPGAALSNIRITGSGAGLAINTAGASFVGGYGSFGAIAYNCDRLVFKDMTIEGVFGGGSMAQEHVLENSTLNGTFYESTIYRPFA